MDRSNAVCRDIQIRAATEQIDETTSEFFFNSFLSIPSEPNGHLMVLQNHLWVEQSTFTLVRFHCY